MKTELNIQYIKNFNDPKEKKNPDEEGMHIFISFETQNTRSYMECNWENMIIP